jgi:hypothetical protein
MELTHIAPIWARRLILPAIVICVIVGCGGIAEGTFLDYFQSGLGRFALVLGGCFILLVGWNGRWLLFSRDTMASVSGGFLYHSGAPGLPATATPIHEILVVYSPLMQLVHLDWATTGERLLTVDTVYRDGMLIVKQLLDAKGLLATPRTDL